MGVSFDFYCQRCRVRAPRLGQGGAVGEPALRGMESFGSIYRALAALKVVTPELEAFNAFLTAHDAHGVRRWADNEAGRDEGRRLAACTPFVYRPGPFREASLELTCRRCGSVQQFRRALLRPFEPFVPSRGHWDRLWEDVLDIGEDYFHRAGFPFDDTLEYLRRFVEEHGQHPITIGLSEPELLRPIGPTPPLRWVLPTWPPDQSEHWIGNVDADHVEMLAQLHHHLPERRLAALGDMHDRATLGYVVPLLRDPEATVRAGAARALGRFGDRRAVRALAIALEDAEAAVRAAATMALGMLDATAEQARREARALRGPYQPIDSVPAPTLAAVDPEQRLRAVEALAASEDPSALHQLLSAAVDPAPVVRCGAARALARFEGEPVVAMLLTLLDDHSTIVAGRAAEVVGPLNVATALEPLLGAFARGAAWDAGHAIELLADARALEPLSTILHDNPHEHVRAQAARTVVALGHDRAVPALRQALRDPSAVVRAEAARALAAVNGPAATERAVMSGRRRPAKAPRRRGERSK